MDEKYKTIFFESEMIVNEFNLSQIMSVNRDTLIVHTIYSFYAHSQCLIKKKLFKKNNYSVSL